MKLYHYSVGTISTSKQTEYFIISVKVK